MLPLQDLRRLLGGATVMLVLGSMYVFGTLSPYIASYLHYQGTVTIIRGNMGHC